VIERRTQIACSLSAILALALSVDLTVSKGRLAPQSAIRREAAAVPSVAGQNNDLETSGLEAGNLERTQAARKAQDPIAAIIEASSSTGDQSAGTSPQGGRDVTTEPGDAGSSEIESVQRELTARGYNPGKINGVAGVMTRCAILAFESDHNLALTAEPSDRLLREILLGPSRSDTGSDRPPGPMASRLIAGTQRLLQSLGYDLPAVTGALDEATVRAIRRFEADSGLAMKGRVSSDVMAELARRSGTQIEVADRSLQ
jgi:peptidoglycan hydrolase-like protein with peptidoglycan-binding domain